MVTFSGRTAPLGKTIYYEYDHNADSGDCVHTCSGFSRDLLDGKYGNHSFGADAESIAWGYSGLGPDYLSVSVLALSIYPRWLKDKEIEDGIPGSMIPHKHPDRLRVIELHKQFTKEVVSKLPDRWTMTSDEVLAWIKDGTLPACIKPKAI